MASDPTVASILRLLGSNARHLTRMWKASALSAADELAIDASDLAPIDNLCVCRTILQSNSSIVFSGPDGPEECGSRQLQARTEPLGLFLLLLGESAQRKEDARKSDKKARLVAKQQVCEFVHQIALASAR